MLSDRGIAQLVEQRSPKPRVPSSILGAPAIFKKPRKFRGFLHYTCINQNNKGGYEESSRIRLFNHINEFFILKLPVSSLLHIPLHIQQNPCHTFR